MKPPKKGIHIAAVIWKSGAIHGCPVSGKYTIFALFSKITVILYMPGGV
ncbi:MAG: hypothetical protein LLG42_10145 [Chloroflexi bacterium]|nr:hypothetical protein [Chloroflexota bacterium]